MEAALGFPHCADHIGDSDCGSMPLMGVVSHVCHLAVAACVCGCFVCLPVLQCVCLMVSSTCICDCVPAAALAVLLHMGEGVSLFLYDIVSLCDCVPLWLKVCVCVFVSTGV